VQVDQESVIIHNDILHCQADAQDQKRANHPSGEVNSRSHLLYLVVSPHALPVK
jgi:hypothetical protein